jgi:scyllo-inositol 2-dehydrogenase (NADP+)
VRVIVVGLGIQGRKRLAVAGSDAVATVDPVIPGANYPAIEDVPLEAYDAALVCTPDEPKEKLLAYLLERGKHVLVEKPLLARNSETLPRLAAIAERTGKVCYTAYNHRFEPHLASVKQLLDDGTIGTVYQAKFFYGNGTARDVRKSPWRDSGLGVISDLASHLLDMVLFFFGKPSGEPQVWAHERFENKASDYFMIGFPDTRPRLQLEGTLLSWRNNFLIDIMGEKGSIHVSGLCKWGPSSLIVRQRVLPSGKPDEEVRTLEQKDPTWAFEYAHFNEICARGGRGNIENDIYINEAFQGIAAQLGLKMLA